MCSILAIFFLMTACHGANILVLMPFPGRSHFIVFEPLWQELAARGHQVTVYSSFPQKKPLTNYTDVDNSYKLPPIISSFDINLIEDKMPNPWITTFFINEVHEINCHSLLLEPQYQELMKKQGHFDVMMLEVCGNDCFAYFSHKLKIPLIAFTTSTMFPWAAERVGLPDNPSYIPNLLASLEPEMTLWERTYNTLVLVYSKFFHQYIYSRRTQAFVEKYFHEPMPPVHEVVKNTSIIFVNSYHALSQSRPFPPNVIEVGGVHVKKRQPLPEEFKKIMDDAKHGVIIMSFGSLVRSSSLPKPVIKAFLSAFAKIPQTVLFKYEEDLPEAPSNVIVRKWIPQRDLTEHEKVVAVILHGGLSSTIEAIQFNKPMIAVPFFGDQQNNVKALTRKGVCIPFNLNDLTEEKITTAIHEIIHNPKYKENMRKLSLEYTDRPMTALDTAVFWTEYVIRHKGAPHLQPVSVNLPLYQYLLLDVIALIVLSLAATLAAAFFIVKQALAVLKRKIFNSPKEVQFSKNES